ncbi:copia protein [Trifolium medium]|uniref:Copia protein n=1 Tax=Trifolium medium TaxID=97028 RepID=A0A392NNL0_9FABA|nr:copia protein [Trifolium medium]
MGLMLYHFDVHKPVSLKVLCDADWASDPGDRRPTSGAAIFFGSSLVSWWSKKQQVVASLICIISAAYSTILIACWSVTCLLVLLQFRAVINQIRGWRTEVHDRYVGPHP